MSRQLFTLWMLDNAMSSLDFAQDILNAGREIEPDDEEFQSILDQQQANLNLRRDNLLAKYYEISSSN